MMKLHRLNTDIDTSSQSIASHLVISARQANAITQSVLHLNDNDLAEWLNSRPQQDSVEMFTNHGKLGKALNEASVVASAVLETWGLQPNIELVDVRSFDEKLAEQNRKVDFTDGIWVVSAL